MYAHALRSVLNGSILCTRKQLLQIVRETRQFSQKTSPELDQQLKKRTTINYLISGIAFAAGMTFAAVPLYRAFCQASGFGGTTQQGEFSMWNCENLPFLHRPRRFRHWDNGSSEGSYFKNQVQRRPERFYDVELQAPTIWNQSGSGRDSFSLLHGKKSNKSTCHWYQYLQRYPIWGRTIFQ